MKTKAFPSPKVVEARGVAHSTQRKVGGPTKGILISPMGGEAPPDAPKPTDAKRNREAQKFSPPKKTKNATLDFDVDAECKFRRIPQREVETACKYEYMRESQSLINKLTAGPKEREEQPRGALPTFAQDFTVAEKYALVVALQKAGFPAPWNGLSQAHKNELALGIGGNDEEGEKRNPPIMIEQVEVVRDFDAEGVKDQNGDQDYCWRINPDSPQIVMGMEYSQRDFFYGVIRIDDGYVQTKLLGAFKEWLKSRIPKSNPVNGNFRPKLIRLAAMRIRHHFPRDKRGDILVEATGKKTFVSAIGKTDSKGKTDSITDKVDVGLSTDCTEALKYFRELFPAQEPRSLSICKKT